jgi:PilZ domain
VPLAARGDFGILPDFTQVREWIGRQKRYMKNRREDYRHPLSQPISVELDSLGESRLAATVVNLCASGMAVQLEPSSRPLKLGSHLHVRLCLPGEAELGMQAVVIYTRSPGDPTCGLSFLPLAEPQAQERRERTIRRFLIAEQRKLKAQLDAVPAGTQSGNLSVENDTLEQDGFSQFSPNHGELSGMHHVVIRKHEE